MISLNIIIWTFIPAGRTKQKNEQAAYYRILKWSTPATSTKHKTRSHKVWKAHIWCQQKYQLLPISCQVFLYLPPSLYSLLCNKFADGKNVWLWTQQMAVVQTIKKLESPTIILAFHNLSASIFTFSRVVDWSILKSRWSYKFKLNLYLFFFKHLFNRVIRGASDILWFPNLTGTVNLESLWVIQMTGIIELYPDFRIKPEGNKAGKDFNSNQCSYHVRKWEEIIVYRLYMKKCVLWEIPYGPVNKMTEVCRSLKHLSSGWLTGKFGNCQSGVHLENLWIYVHTGLDKLRLCTRTRADMF